MAKIPARAMLSFIMDIYAMNERAISRRRELLADQAGAEASSARALITALAKTAFYSVLWEGLRNENVDRLHRGKASRNLSGVLEGKVRYDIDDEKLTKAIAEVAKRTVPHPTDSHPPIGVRMKSLGIDAGSIAVSDMAVPENSAILLFRNSIALEENLSVMEHKHLADLGLAPPTGRGTGGAGPHLAIIYRMAVAMSGDDGRLSADRVRVAETVGAELFPGFEATDFRQAYSYAAEIPDLERLAEDLNELIDADQKQSVIGFLKRVAEADGEMSLGEQIYIEAVAEELGIAA